jgi:predicted transcriptional regulator YdeE
MEYEIVNLEAKTVVGLAARTNNSAPDMGMIIGGLWTRFYQDGIYAAIANKKNDKSLGIYTEYAGREMDDYTVEVACEVTEAVELPQGTITAEVPAGKYAKFVVHGHMMQAVADFWAELWKMDLNRSFVCDFEEYQDCEEENATIHIYIGLVE